MSDIVEAWLWRDPGEIIERLLRKNSGRGETNPAPSPGAPPRNRPQRDRYYTMARRYHVKQLMRNLR